MPDDIRDLWQQQDLEQLPITLEEIRRRAGRFHRRIRMRNLLEYTVGMLMIAVFSFTVWKKSGWHRIAPVLLIGGIAYLLYQLHRRAAARRMPANAGARASVAFFRQELERQRDAVRSVWTWYQLPVLPGLIAMCLDVAMTRGINARYLAGVAYCVFIYVAVWLLNQRAARRLDLKIRELQAMEEDNDG